MKVQIITITSGIITEETTFLWYHESITIVYLININGYLVLIISITILVENQITYSKEIFCEHCYLFGFNLRLCNNGLKIMINNRIKRKMKANQPSILDKRTVEREFLFYMRTNQLETELTLFLEFVT